MARPAIGNKLQDLFIVIDWFWIERIHGHMKT